MSRERPSCHVFQVDGKDYAYDLNTQSVLALEPPLAELMRTGVSGGAEAHAALRRAREDGLFLPCAPTLVPRPAPSAAEVDRGLRHLVLTVTESCNLRCAYCLHGADLDWVRPHGSRRMSVTTALQATDYYLDRSDVERPPAISFYGGEPLRSLDVIEAVVWRVRTSPRGADALLSIDTNGVLLAGRALDLVVRETIHLQVSLDGPAEIHDRYRRDVAGSTTHGRILSNLGRLLDRDPDAAKRMSFVATLAPPVDLSAVADFFGAFPPFIERGIARKPHVRVNIANLRGLDWQRNREADTGLPSLEDQIDTACELYFEAFAKERREQLSPVIRSLFEPALIRWHHRSRGPLGKTYAPGGNCQPGRRKLHITADGRLQPCERMGPAGQLGTIGGGLQTAAVTRLQDRFHGVVAASCESCWALRMCGVCYAAVPAIETRGAREGEGPLPACEAVRRQAERDLRLAVRMLSMPAQSRSWLEKTVLA